MSVVDQYREAEQRVAQRLKELEPAVAEYRELEEVAKRLGIHAVSQPAPTASGGSRRQRGARASTRSSAGSGSSSGGRQEGPTRRQQAVQLVKDRPGITVAEMAEEMGIKQNYLYRVIPEMEKKGALRREGSRWYLAEGSAAASNGGGSDAATEQTAEPAAASAAASS